MEKKCVECGKEIKEQTDSDYCQACDEKLDRQFESVEDNILIYKDLLPKEIDILNKFEKEDIIDLYKRAYDSFKSGGPFTEEQANILKKMAQTFNLKEDEIGSDRKVEYKEVKKVVKDACPNCDGKIKEDFIFCPYCAFRLKD